MKTTFYHTMKTIFFCFILLFFSAIVSAQQSAVISKTIYAPAINNIFVDDVKSDLSISYPIRKGYYNKDKSGEFYILITESFDGLNGADSLSKNLRILKVAKQGPLFTIKGEINDHVVGPDETSIWVWTRYCEFNDVDKDGLIDPILVYGSSAANGVNDGRLKILTWYKDRKVVIRHQNGTLDDERNTQVDPAFYNLPLVLQNRVRSIMLKLNDKTDIIFPYGWQKAMDKKKLKFDEQGG